MYLRKEILRLPALWLLISIVIATVDNVPEYMCFDNFRFPYRPPIRLPDRITCEKAIKEELGGEPQQHALRIITTRSGQVPQGAYLYPHAWTSGLCSVVVSIQRPALADTTTYEQLVLDALAVLDHCSETRYGGRVRGGDQNNIKITVVHTPPVSMTFSSANETLTLAVSERGSQQE